MVGYRGKYGCSYCEIQDYSKFVKYVHWIMFLNDISGTYFEQHRHHYFLGTQLGTRRTCFCYLRDAASNGVS